MNKYNLRVHLSDRRENENRKTDFKFTTETELYTLSKWLGYDTIIFSSWLRNKENVSYGTKIKYYNINYSGIKNYNYDNENYHLINWDSLLNSILSPIHEIYKNKYSDDDDWYNNIYSDTLFDRDPVFAEKVIIQDPSSKIFIVGDIHSSIHSLLDILNELRAKDIFVDDTFEMKKDNYLFFLGDLVDRGPYGIEILSLVLILQIKNPNSVYIINGNHEDESTYKRYGLQKEINNQFAETDRISANIKIKMLLYYLPSVIYLKFGDKYFHLSHGAILRPEILQEKLIDIKLYLNDTKKYMLIHEFDPNSSLKWGDLRVTNGYNINDRLGRPIFGQDKIKEYCLELGISSLITGHQDQESLLIQPNPDSEYFKENQSIGNSLLSIGPDEKTFEYCRDGDCKVVYDLYSVSNKTSFNLDPIQDFYGLVTSTATISKDLLYNCYLELTQIIKENVIIEGEKDQGLRKEIEIELTEMKYEGKK